MRPLLAAATALFVLVSLSACDPSATTEGPPPLEGAAIGGPFTLTGEDGQTVRWSDFDGKYRMVYFGYTWCPDVCPFDLNRMMDGYRQWAGQHPELAGQVQPIFITVDPERDTPAKITEYTAKFGDNLLGLTGTPEAIAEAKNSFSVWAERGPDDPNVGYMMEHSNAAYLMGRQGEPIALLSVDESGEKVAQELGRWVR